jgi:type IV secretory pathway TrbL component
MALDDFLESEVAIAVGATAALLSPRVRGVLRSGAVYGLAGVLIAGDAVGSVARGVGRGTQQAASTAGGVAQEAAGAASGVAQSAAERVRGAGDATQSET